MRKKILYLFAFVLSMSLYAVSRDCIKTGNCAAICKKHIPDVPKAGKPAGEDDLLELSPLTHLLIFQI
jgi:hypothetical protein